MNEPTPQERKITAKLSRDACRVWDDLRELYAAEDRPPLESFRIWQMRRDMLPRHQRKNIRLLIGLNRPHFARRHLDLALRAGEEMPEDASPEELLRINGEARTALAEYLEATTPEDAPEAQG